MDTNKSQQPEETIPTEKNEPLSEDDLVSKIKQAQLKALRILKTNPPIPDAVAIVR